MPAPEHAAEPGAVLPHEPRRSASSSPARSKPRTDRAARPTDFFALKGADGARRGAADRRVRVARRRGGGTSFASGQGRAEVTVAGAGGVAPITAAGRGRGLRRRRPPAVLRVAEHGPDRPDRPEDDGVRRARDLTRRPPRTLPWIGRDVPAAAVVKQAGRAGKVPVRSVRRLDVYEGDQVPADKRSLALRVVMRSPERTLSEKDIAGVRAKILKALERSSARRWWQRPARGRRSLPAAHLTGTGRAALSGGVSWEPASPRICLHFIGRARHGL